LQAPVAPLRYIKAGQQNEVDTEVGRKRRKEERKEYSKDGRQRGGKEGARRKEGGFW